jgi:hypothetical protein
VLTDIDRLTTAIEGIGLTAKQLPDKIGKEREKLMSDLLRSEDKLRALSGDFRQTLAAGDKTAASFNQAILSYDKLLSRMYARAKPGSFEIQEWLETLRQATEAAKQTQALVVMVDKLATDPGLEQRVTQLNRGLNALLQRAFLWTALIIVFFFLVLLAYRYLSQRFAGARPAS